MYTKRLIIHLMIIVALIVIIFYFVIRPRQNKFTVNSKEHRKLRNTINEKIEMYLIPFQYKEYSPDHIINQKNIIAETQEKQNKEWYMISGITNSSNYILTTSICYAMSNNVADFILMTFTMNQLSNTLSQLCNFIT